MILKVQLLASLGRRRIEIATEYVSAAIFIYPSPVVSLNYLVRHLVYLVNR